MTLLKRLRDEARKEYVYHSPEIGDYIQNLDHPDDINDLIANTVTTVLDEVEREVEEHGNKVLGLYGGRLPYTFFGGNEEDNRMQIYLAAHKDIIKTITNLNAPKYE